METKPRDVFGQVLHELRAWSLFHYLFDAGVTLVVGSIGQAAMSMGGTLVAVFWVGVFLLTTSGIVYVRQSHEKSRLLSEARSQRLRNTIHALHALIDFAAEVRKATQDRSHPNAQRFDDVFRSIVSKAVLGRTRGEILSAINEGGSLELLRSRVRAISIDEVNETFDANGAVQVFADLYAPLRN